jgi:UDP-N-acetylglucosamine 4-epimerase
MVSSVKSIMHQAALALFHVLLMIRLPPMVNVSGFLNMLVAAKDAKVKRFIYAASSSTYGDSADCQR